MERAVHWSGHSQCRSEPVLCLFFVYFYLFFYVLIRGMFVSRFSPFICVGMIFCQNFVFDHCISTFLSWNKWLHKSLPFIHSPPLFFFCITNWQGTTCSSFKTICLIWHTVCSQGLICDMCMWVLVQDTDNWCLELICICSKNENLSLSI